MIVKNLRTPMDTGQGRMIRYNPYTPIGIPMQAASTIYIREDLKEKLRELKRHPKESYNDVIERLATRSVDDEPLNSEAIKGLEEARDDIRHHRLSAEEEVMAEFGGE
jgi:predicted CopG family antitoxin